MNQFIMYKMHLSYMSLNHVLAQFKLNKALYKILYQSIQNIIQRLLNNVFGHGE